MRAADRIARAAKRAGLTGQVYKGNDADGGRGYRYGWWVKPFNHNAIYLGQSASDALKAIAQRADR